MPYSKYISRLSNHDKIDEIAAIAKEFLKDHFHIRYELTFKELADSMHGKHMPPDIKPEIIDLCNQFENLEYNPKKPSKKEIDNIKKSLRKMINALTPDEGSKKESLLKTIGIAGILHKKKEKPKIMPKISDIRKRVEVKIKNSMSEDNIYEDEECKEISRYISASRNGGHNLSSIRKELKEMGFHNSKIYAVIENLKKEK